MIHYFVNRFLFLPVFQRALDRYAASAVEGVYLSIISLLILALEKALTIAIDRSTELGCIDKECLLLRDHLQQALGKSSRVTTTHAVSGLVNFVDTDSIAKD